MFNTIMTTTVVYWAGVFDFDGCKPNQNEEGMAFVRKLVADQESFVFGVEPHWIACQGSKALVSGRFPSR